jgi:endonuclease/exonuclease/phosphatase family metal-dependent hydrolase
LEKILDIIDKENKICYLMGDFNIDLFKSESCDYSNRFLEQLFTSSYFPLITKATRVTHHTTTLIDNIFTNNIEKINDSIIILSDLSDHLPIVHSYNTNVFHNIIQQNSNSYMYKRIINKTNILLF